MLPFSALFTAVKVSSMGNLAQSVQLGRMLVLGIERVLRTGWSPVTCWEP
jgi:hypothetical protein